jgi:hypothetical protein
VNANQVAIKPEGVSQVILIGDVPANPLHDVQIHRNHYYGENTNLQRLQCKLKMKARDGLNKL